MRRVLVDLNVVLDVLLDRQPFVTDSSALWEQIETRRLEGALAAHAITTLHYLASRRRGRAFADRCVAQVLTVFQVATVDEIVVRRALSLGWDDFEDAVTALAAEGAECDAIATRDPRGYRGASVPALLPAAIVARLMATPADSGP